jgi:thiol-disulfide isomerase/thioredoxin
MKLHQQIALAALTILAVACGNEQPADHQGALPHNMTQGTELTAEESKQLAQAKGIAATQVTPASLAALLKTDTNQLIVLNFWKKDCAKCLQLQQALQALQTPENEGKMTLYAINTEPDAHPDAVNLSLRQAGIAAKTLWLPAPKEWYANFSPGWSGELPAFFVQQRDGLQQLYRQSFTEPELAAILQPLLME